MSRQSFRDCTAIITGASSGIGRELALALAAEGARLALAARRVEALEALASEIRSLGGEALAIPTDVIRREQVERLVQESLRAWGRIDLLICNAGLYQRVPVARARVEQIERSMAVNFYGSVYPVLAALPHMLERRAGHIVLVTSMDAKKGMPNEGVYVAAKSALAGFGDVLRQELHGTGVRVTVVFPGRVDTPMIAGLRVPAISYKSSPRKTAADILAGVRRGRAEVITPAYTRSLYYLHAFSPALADLAVRVFHLQGWLEEREES